MRNSNLQCIQGWPSKGTFLEPFEEMPVLIPPARIFQNPSACAGELALAGRLQADFAVGTKQSADDVNTVVIGRDKLPDVGSAPGCFERVGPQR